MKGGRHAKAGSSKAGDRRRFSPKQLTLAACLMAAALFAGYALLFPPAYGAQLPFRSMQLSDDDVSVSANYYLKFFINSISSVGSISVQFCSNSAFITDPCTPPPGFDDSAATLTDQVGETGFSISPATTANEIILTRVPNTTTVHFASYEFSGVTNPSAPGSYFVRVQTYASTDATGPATDFGSMAIAYTNSIAISAEVPPFLIFCTGVTIPTFNCASAVGDFIDMGELSSTHAVTTTSQMLVATNAQSGYGITVDGPTMASGTNVINQIGTDDVSRPGTGQFGFNLRANTTPGVGSNPTGPGSGTPSPAYNQPNLYQFNTGDLVASSPLPENYREYTSAYLVNVPNTQAPGIYVTTITYIALATF